MTKETKKAITQVQDIAKPINQAQNNSQIPNAEKNVGNNGQQTGQNPSFLESAKSFVKPVAKLGAGAGLATAAALLIAGPIGIIIAALIAAFALFSAGKDVKEIYDNKSAKSSSKNPNGNQIIQVQDIAKNLLDNEKIKPFINTHNKSDDKNKIDEETIESFVKHSGNNGTEENSKLQENFQTIADHYKKNPVFSAALGLALKDIYNKNCKEGNEIYIKDVAKLQNPEKLAKLFNNLKDDSKEKFVGLVALIASNPQIIDDFAKNPNQINELMKECKENGGDIDVIKNTIEEKLKPVESKNSQQNNNEQPMNIRALLEQAGKNQEASNNSQIPNVEKNVENNGRQK